MRFTAFTSLFTILLLAAACSAPTPADAPIETVQPVVQPLPVSAEGETCGGIAALQCEDGYFCKVEPGACVNIADYAGTCQKVRLACTREYAPVCGCNAKTYPNACEAYADSTSVAHEGACTG